MPLLTDLLARAGVKAELSPAAKTVDIRSITADSRQAGAGTLFVAVPGAKADGKQFIPQALGAGAAAALSDGWRQEDAPWAVVENPRLALSKLAAAFYEKQPAHIVAVTGTDGKTSTAEFTRQLWELLGHKAASIGTLGTLGEGRKELAPGINTTPDPVGLHKMLAELAEAGYMHVCMEASSHGLDQYRLDGVRVQAAAFTNLTRDHLDYHGTDEAYFAAKARLFTDFAIETAVINADDPRAEALERICAKRKIDYTVFGHTLQHWLEIKSGPGFFQRFILEDITPLAHGQKIRFSASYEWKKAWFGLALKQKDKDFEYEIPLVGAFQVYNMLASAGLVLASGQHKVEDVLALLPKLKGVPGRLEHVATHPSGAPAYIDYAHTPAALANVLKTLRAHTEKRLVIVFGCGGDRDRGKRPQMAQAAAELADLVIVTDDNPRSEDPAAIRTEVMAGAPRAKEVAGRREAIYGAIRLLQAGDVLLVAGKGHEKTQIIGNVTHPFDDAEVVREAVAEL